MNQEQIASLLRTLIQTIGAAFGYTALQNGETAAAIATGLAILGVTFWGLWARKDSNLVASAANVPKVKEIIATPDIANAIPSPKVVPGH